MQINSILKLIYSGAIALILLCFSSMSCAQNNSPYWTYNLKKGESLWTFADYHLKSTSFVSKLSKLNNINNSYKIKTNTQIKVPFEWVRQSPSSAKINAISGEVLLKLPNSAERVANIGDLAPSGSSIKTGKNSQAILQFADGSNLVLSSNTAVVFDKLIYFLTTGSSDNNIVVKNGNVSSHVSKPLLMNNRYQIKTPSAITSVRGTVLTVGVGKEQQTLTAVLSGKVELNKGSQTRVIPSGYGDIASMNGDPMMPEKLINPPNIDQLAKAYKYNKPYLTWSAVKDAASYHVELYLDGKNKTLLRDEKTSSPAYFPADLKNASYLLKVASLKANGLQGKLAEVKFSVDAPHPPLVLSLPNKTIAKKELTYFLFSKHNLPLIVQLWQEDKTLENKDSFILESASPSELQAKSASFKVNADNNFFYKIKPDSGIWLWRFARIINANGDHEQFSITRSILARESGFHLPTTQPETVSIEPLPIKNAKYKLTLATDKNFKHIVYQRTQNKYDWVLPEYLSTDGQSFWAKVEVSADYDYLYSYPVQKVTW